MIEIQISEERLDVKNIFDLARSSSAGAVNIFVGTVRDNTQSRQVSKLEYEAYEKMARSEIRKIINSAIEKWPIQNVIVHHRNGTLAIGDEAVVIAVSTPHRKDSFEATEFIIDTLKQTVPIWKKEIFTDGEVWVASHP